MKTILTVDDSPQDAELLQCALEDAGITNPVFTVRTCLEAMAYLRGVGAYTDRVKHPFPAVLFMDLKLPVMDGYEFLKWVKADSKYADLLVIALSGTSELGYARRAVELGANIFIAKPCSETDIKVLQERFPSYWEPQTGVASSKPS